MWQITLMKQKQEETCKSSAAEVNKCQLLWDKVLFFFLLFITFFWLWLCCVFVALCCKWKTGCDDALACGVWELLTSWHNHIFPFWILTAFSCLYCFTLSIHLSQMASLIILLSLSPIVASTGEWKHVFIFSNII